MFTEHLLDTWHSSACIQLPAAHLNNSHHHHPLHLLQLVAGLLDILQEGGLSQHLYPRPHDSTSMVCVTSRSGVRVDAQFDSQ